MGRTGLLLPMRRPTTGSDGGHLIGMGHRKEETDKASAAMTGHEDLIWVDSQFLQQ